MPSLVHMLDTPRTGEIAGRSPCPCVPQVDADVMVWLRSPHNSLRDAIHIRPHSDTPAYVLGAPSAFRLLSRVGEGDISALGCGLTGSCSSTFQCYSLGNHLGVTASHSTVTPDTEAFLGSLRYAWTEGEVRPTARTKPKLRRERRRPDPLLRVTNELRLWFDEEPWRTGRQLLERLQGRYPDEYPDQLLRTVQRRVKEWRREKAHVMIFGSVPEVASQPVN